MRRLLTPSALVPCAILAVVAGVVVWTNVKEGRPAGRPSASRTSSSIAAFGSPGGASTSRDGLARRVADMEARLAKRPDDVAAAVSLADALIRQVRITGRASAVARAEDVLRTALAQDPGNYDVLRMQGSLYLSQHRFREALAVGEKARAVRPQDAVAYGVIGDAHLELGEYDQAFDAFDRMMALRPNAASYARVAYARELQGQLAGALESMTLAADASLGGDVEATAWYCAQVGDLLLRLDRPGEAMQAFAQASQAFPGHPFAVAGYARALEAVGRGDDARALLEDLVKKAPTPDVHARLGDLLAAAGRAEEAGRQYALAEAAWRSDMPEPRSLARFLADRGVKIDEAVAIAEGAVAERQDIFTEDALAWAYFKAGRVGDAQRAIAQALRTGTKDRDILRHAQEIARASQMARR